MASLREAEVAPAIVAALGVASVGGTPKPAGLTVHRRRNRPVEGGGLPAMVVWFAAEGVTYDATSKADRTLRFWVGCWVEVADQAVPDVALDALLVWAVKALQADITLGGATIDVREIRTVWDFDIEAEDLACANVEFEAVYQTSYSNPEAV